MKRNRPIVQGTRVLTRLVLHGLFMLLVGNATAVWSADLLRVQPITDKILVLEFSEGHIDYFGSGQELVTGNRVYYARLDVNGASQRNNYTISSPDDERYRDGLAPVAVGRKSKGQDFHDLYASPMPPVLLRHWIYLELPTAMIAGKNYTIKLNKLASNRNSLSFTFDAFKLHSPTVHVNQIGMLPHAKKYAYLSHYMGSLNTAENIYGALNLDRYANGLFYLVRTSDDSVVFAGSISMQRAKSAADFTSNTFKNVNMTRADVWQCDFSDYQTPGEYRVVVGNMGCSYPFIIGADAYRAAYYYTSRALFTQRQGVNREIEPDVIYPRDHRTEDGIVMKYYSDLRTEGNFDPKLGRGPVSGVWGWYHDAGDWDTYPDHYAVPMTLLILYDLKPENFGDGDVSPKYQISASDPWIEEGRNGLPDLLDEALWLVRYYKRAKDALIEQGFSTGGVPGYAGVDAGAESGTPSWQDKRPMALKGADSVLMAYRYAACAAYLSVCLDKFKNGVHQDSPGWIDEARASFQWAGAQNQDSDANINRSRMIAAAALYRYTGLTVYQDAFRSCKSKDSEWKSALWFSLSPWHYCSVIFGKMPDQHPGLDKNLRQQCVNDLVQNADHETVQTANDRGFRYGAARDILHMLGAFSTPKIFMAAAAYEFTGDKKYLDACCTTSDYCLGGNQMDLVKVSGLGENPEQQPFHCDSWYLTDYNSLVYNNPILPGYVIYEMHKTGDWMAGTSWNWIGDEDYSRSTAFPAIDFFPDAEARFPNRWSIAGSEFTIHQTQSMAVFAYGYLCGRYVMPYSANQRPEVALMLFENSLVSLDSTLVLTVKSSNDVRRVEYYYDWHFIGESVAREQNFAFSWNLTDYQMTAGKHLITAKAFDDQGLESRPTPEGDCYLIFARPSAVKDEIKSDRYFELKNCYPNPANPTTRIEFSLADQGRTLLEVYNALGEKVATLLNCRLQAGVHNIDVPTAQFVSGVYYCKLQQDTQLDVKKFLVLK